MVEELTGSALDIQSFRVLKAIADEGSITAAADLLGYSQPAVSQQLRRLECRIGLAVVERVGRSVRLTEAGRILARYAPAVTTALDAAAEEIAELRGLRAGRVRLVGFPSASPALVPRMLADLAARHPGLTLTYVEAEPPEAVNAVREDRADIALTFSYPGDRNDPHGSSSHGLAVRAIGSDDLLAILARDHPAAVGEQIELADLAGDDWIAGCPRCRGHLLEVCDRAGFVPRIAFETDNVAAVEGLVAQGIGVALMPRMAVESFPQRPGIVAMPVPTADRRTIHLVTAHGAERAPSVRAVLAAITRVIETD
ncbi:MAG: LysR family transcriptional regulator [Ruaniaceae bacterium]|nr:LysR family transcriptional regulator [Ruaniaceae bacterium]